ncbi:MAG TPA: hypothetical protein VGP76_11440 [Planctomycetaceae bacterium]|jgi:hypothetical protein|nr:hypothetical protein [Planctomycetaceae bacterium]
MESVQFMSWQFEFDAPATARAQAAREAAVRRRLAASTELIEFVTADAFAETAVSAIQWRRPDLFVADEFDYVPHRQDLAMALRVFCESLMLAAVVGFPGCSERIETSAKASLPTKEIKPADAVTHAGQKVSAPHGYSNKVNRLVEQRLDVTNRRGAPAVRGMGSRPDPQPMKDVELKIVWTSPNKYDWNYVVPEIHHGKDLFTSEFPSERMFLEKTTNGKTFLVVRVPDTPYEFEIIDGRVSPFFMDREKGVMWKVSGMDQEFRGMSSISLSSKRITFIAEGGDIVTFLDLDFSNREDAPRVAYEVQGGSL